MAAKGILARGSDKVRSLIGIGTLVALSLGMFQNCSSPNANAAVADQASKVQAVQPAANADVKP